VQSPAAPPVKPSLWNRIVHGGWKTVLAVPPTLAVLAGVVTNWDTIKAAIFSSSPPAEATIVAAVEPDISRQEFNLQDHPPVLLPGSSAAVPGSSAQRSGYRFAVYSPPADASQGARLLSISAEEPPKAPEQTNTSASEQKIKEEGEKITEEAKHDEELAAQEKTQAASEAKQAEMRAQEEQKKEQEAQKRAEETQTHDHAKATAQAKTEVAKARTAAEAAKETVRAKRLEAARPPSQRRAEVGTPVGRVEEVLHAAHLDEGCQPTCAMKPLVEKALKASSGNAAVAARQVRVVASSSTGARVHYDVTVKGLEHKEVVLTYSLVQTNGPPPPATYLDTVTIKTFTPSRQREQVVGSCWVGLPSSARSYYVELTVYDGETEVKYTDTPTFR